MTNAASLRKSRMITDECQRPRILDKYLAYCVVYKVHWILPKETNLCVFNIVHCKCIVCQSEMIILGFPGLHCALPSQYMQFLV